MVVRRHDFDIDGPDCLGVMLACNTASAGHQLRRSLVLISNSPYYCR